MTIFWFFYNENNGTFIGIKEVSEEEAWKVLTLYAQENFTEYEVSDVADTKKLFKLHGITSEQKKGVVLCALSSLSDIYAEIIP